MAPAADFRRQAAAANHAATVEQARLMRKDRFEVITPARKFLNVVLTLRREGIVTAERDDYDLSCRGKYATMS